ncbi:MAG: alkaline shock response membrane anchor protein AmaP [Thermaerobacterales bacterium]
MSIFFQVILAVYTIVLTGVSFLIVLIALGWTEPLLLLQASLTHVPGRWTIGIVGLAFFVASIRLLYFVFRFRSMGETLVHETQLGEVQISLRAVENLVVRAGRQVEGVKELRARVDAGKQGIRVHLRGTVSQDVSIPEISDRLQNVIRRHVRNVVGVEVEEIRVHIEDIGSETRRRRIE